MKEQFTFESENKTNQYETYEWDNIWWEHAEKMNDSKRILVIGDSISCGFRGFINAEYNQKVYIDGLGTSKAVDNPMFYKTIEYMALQYPDYEVIQFNNGLHGWHLTTEEYEENFLKILSYIKEKFPKSKLIVALSTPVKDEKDNKIVDERNIAASRVAEKLEAYILDLYSTINGNNDLYIHDGVHLTDEGYTKLAKQCIALYEKIR